MKYKYIVFDILNNTADNLNRYPCFEYTADAKQYIEENKHNNPNLRYWLKLEPESINDYIEYFDSINHKIEYAETQMPYHITLKDKVTQEKELFTISYFDACACIDDFENYRKQHTGFISQKGNNKTLHCSPNELPQLYAIKNHHEKIYERDKNICNQIATFVLYNSSATSQDIADFLKSTMIFNQSEETLEQEK